MIEKAYISQTTKNSVKNILVFLPTFPVASETFILRDLLTLKSLNNFNLFILALNGTRSNLPKDLQNITLYQSLNIITLLHGFIISIFNFKNLLLTAKIILFCKEDTFLKRVYFFIKGIGYTSIIKSFNPSHVHIHFLSDFSSVGFVACLILGIPVSFNVHAKDVLVYPSLPKTKIKYANFITACNTKAFNACKKFYSDAKNIHLIFHGLSKEMVLSKNKYVSTKDLVLFLGATRLEEKKGIQVVLQACKNLKEIGVTYKLFLLKTGALYNYASNFVKDNNLQNFVEFVGDDNGVSYSVASSIYNITDIFIYPAINVKNGDSDGIPNVLIEAAYFKLPIITTNAGSIGEFLTEKEALLIEQNNVDALLKAIKTLTKNNSLCKKLGENAFEKATFIFDSNKNVSKLAELLLQ